MDLGLRDRVFLVTGGARGLGRATADELVGEGARVVISSRTAASVSRAAHDLGEQAVGVVADNADPDTPSRLVGAALERWGRLDGALVSVGGPPRGPVTTVTDEQWTASFGSVFLGAVRLARQVGEVLGPGGSIAFVLSTTARAPQADMALSNGLRPGLAMVAKTLADELGPAGIRVNGLLPGRVHTERLEELEEASGDPAAARRAGLAEVPLGRYGEPAEFGRVAAFLLSPASSFVSGAMVPVDGGMLRAL
ncbi:SDR family oxidoreductase [Nocardioides sp.]|uniref:SDR family oxidoreductase n=1 Tax=Nocardioides sp. TaxID=35761 RepID=UPI003782D393